EKNSERFDPTRYEEAQETCSPTGRGCVVGNTDIGPKGFWEIACELSGIEFLPDCHSAIRRCLQNAYPRPCLSNVCVLAEAPKWLSFNSRPYFGAWPGN